MEHTKIVDLLFEIGTLRKISRGHGQALLTTDPSDNISSHSYRVIVIGYFLAIIEGVDPLTVMLMCMSHDWPETRSNDHNWIHKKYISINTEAIIFDQAALHQSEKLSEVIDEYEKRISKASLVAKDADTLDQIFLLKEYTLQGNKEAQIWLDGRSKKRPYAQIDRLKLESSKQLGRALYDKEPSDWWKDIYTNVNQTFQGK